MAAGHFGIAINDENGEESTNAEDEVIQESTSLIMSVSAQRITVYLEHQGLYLGTLDVIDYQMNIRVKTDQLDVQGSLSQFKINDLTQYPATCTNPEDYAEFKGEEIFSTNKNESAVKFSFPGLSLKTLGITTLIKERSYSI